MHALFTATTTACVTADGNGGIEGAALESHGCYRLKGIAVTSNAKQVTVINKKVAHF